jgi:hypothetical protein
MYIVSMVFTALFGLKVPLDRVEGNTRPSSLETLLDVGVVARIFKLLLEGELVGKRVVAFIRKNRYYSAGKKSAIN